MSDEITTTTLTFVPCTIRTLQGGEERPGMEAEGTGLGYATEEGEPPHFYFIIHLASGLPIVPGLYVCDERTVQEAIGEIVQTKLADWTLPKEELFTQIGERRHALVVKTLKEITERHEKADTIRNTRTFTFSYTLRGTISVEAMGKGEARDVAKDALRELNMDDDDDVRNFSIDDITTI